MAESARSRCLGLGMIRLGTIARSAPEAVSSLLACLNDSAMENRLRAVRLLAEIRPQSEAARSALRGLSSDPKYAVRAAALDAIRRGQYSAVNPAK